MTQIRTQNAVAAVANASRDEPLSAFGTETFLAPIEQPKGLMKLVYYLTRRQFGKVLTPLKVHAARLPWPSASSPEKSASSTGSFCCHRK